MSVRELIESNFDRLKDDCLNNTTSSVSGYSSEDAFLDSLSYLLVSDKSILSYEDLRDFVRKRMNTTRNFKYKTYYSQKTISYDALYQKAKEEE